jgi:hypothetical protein
MSGINTFQLLERRETKKKGQVLQFRRTGRSISSFLGSRIFRRPHAACSNSTDCDSHAIVELHVLRVLACDWLVLNRSQAFARLAGKGDSFPERLLNTLDHWSCLSTEYGVPRYLEGFVWAPNFR